MKKYHSLRLILGDQLNASHSWYREQDDGVLYLIAELHQEASYVRHHVQKVCAFFAAIESFANALSAAGHQVKHLTLDDTAEFADLNTLIAAICAEQGIEQFEYQQPDEYRLAEQLQNLDLGIPVTCWESEHFLLTHDELASYIKVGKHNRMESFYRKLRKRFDILMDGAEPLGERWNFDGENRNKLKAADIQMVPQPLMFANPVGSYLERIKKHKIDTLGSGTEELLWPVNRQQSLQLLDFFCEYCLPNFGRFQDAMTQHGESRWSLYHSRISFALNCKILHPMQVIDAALKRFSETDSGVDLAQVEGFVRQILGWREYVRAVYWVNMPDYAKGNSFGAERDLPDYFWTGETKMACMKQAIDQSLEYAYAHHIQRLMVTGNFAMLAGIDPDQVDQWYLGIYIDAIEWVEMPNTRGMSQFADGGLIATKPYAASGSYINKMSDYCKDCHYSVKERFTEDACPFNSLYWHFMQRHSERFSRNPRTAMAYRTWNKMDSEVRQALLARADFYLENLNDL
ncbi:MAG: cryptochrome/photolyase family protein [Porticoccaceae bacterium]|jgi:deoxyribodipyrimidine photolyase-related protein|nr:cryptochrome/photolyase family protein [Porticoccaceae bacterium]